MKAGFPYQRLGPRTSHIFGHDSLWLGADHLLAVHNNRFVEDYLRFDLGEIQALVIRRQFRFIVPVYWLVGCFVAFVMAMTGMVSGRRPLADTGWGLLALLAVYWLTASLAGSCSLHLQTAVDSYELPGLYRYRPARRVFETLAARIAEVQGILPEDWTAVETSEATPSPADAVEANPAPKLLPALACVALLADALISWLIRGGTPSRIVNIGSMAATLIAVVLPVVAIVITRRDKRLRPIRVLFLIAVFAVGFANYASVGLTQFLATLQRTGQAAPPVAGFNAFLYWLNQIAEVSVGAVGLLNLMHEARAAAGRIPSAP